MFAFFVNKNVFAKFVHAGFFGRSRLFDRGDEALKKC